jgi:glycerol dehydrogenase-like iron-containing ADH family enzyme
MSFENNLFHIVYGRNLVRGLAETASPPYLLVTMKDLWHISKDELSGKDLAHAHFVKSLELNYLNKLIKELPKAASVIGIGGGMAIDVAKFIAWRRNLPLFSMPTSTSVNAAFTHRTAVRIKGVVRYIGWAVPEVVYVDYDIIKSASPHINRAGVGDVFCIHTAHYDWKLATERGKEKLWPWNEELAEKAKRVLQSVREKASEINKVSDEGIRTLMEAHRWTGASYHNYGWNPRPIEGCEHFFFYTLEYLTKKKFIHGEPVCLGIIFMSFLQNNDPEGILKSIKEVGVRIRPEEMNVTWDDVIKALKYTKKYSEENKLFYTTINEREITEEIIMTVKECLT